MRLRRVLVAGAIAAASITGFAQVTGSGSTNTVPKFTGSSTIGNSAISEVNGNVGIGTTSPDAPLKVYTGNGTTKIFGPNLELNNFSTEYNLSVASGNFNIQNNSDAGAPIRFTIQGGSGFVGIGTASPLSPLSVGGQVVIGNPYKGDASLQIAHAYGCCSRMTQIAPDAASQNALNIMGSNDSNNNTQWFTWGVNGGSWNVSPGLNFGSGFTINPSGSVGIGTTSPAAKLDVAGKIHADGMAAGNQQTLIGYSGISQFGGLNSGQPIFLSNGGDGGNNQFFYNMYQNFESLTFGAVNFGSSPYGGVNGASFSSLFKIRGDGAIFTGRPQNTPNSSNSNPDMVVSNMLDNGAGDMAVSRNLGVAGNVALTGGGAHMTYPDGTVQSTAWNGTTCGGDYAESVDVTGDRKRYEAGDVLVIDADSPDKFLHSSEPYSRFVAGIYSTRPGLTGRREGRAKTGEEVPMAMLGIVPTKVSAENGAIRPGDLLVSSATEGFAMKGTDTTKMMGAVIGKAMGRLDKGTGTIEVLVSLQ